MAAFISVRIRVFDERDFRGSGSLDVEPVCDCVEFIPSRPSGVTIHLATASGFFSISFCRVARVSPEKMQTSKPYLLLVLVPGTTTE